MKIYKYLLALFPLFTFSQPNPEGYLKTIDYQINLTENYPNFYQELILSDLIYNFETSGDESSGFVSINNNILNVSINKTWAQKKMKVGIIKHLDVYPILPNVDLGPILSTSSGAQTGYFVRIENNNLVIYSPYDVENLNTPTPVLIASYVPNSKFNFLGRSGSGLVTINENKLFFDYQINSMGLNPTPTGTILSFDQFTFDYGGGLTSIAYFPDTDLGILESNSYNTIYRAKIENNKLIIYADAILPVIPSSGFLNFLYDLTTLRPPMWYKDNDKDGFGSPNETSTGTASPPTGYVANNLDCDDNNNLINPDTIWYIDKDGDTYGALDSPTITACIQPIGYVIRSGDCNDLDGTLNPETVWFKNDSHNYYPVITSCYQPSGYTDHYSITPGPGQLPGRCIVDGKILNPDTQWYFDGDGDGYGDNAISERGCIQPPKHVLNNLDCDDSDETLNPTTIWYEDWDKDGFGSMASTATGCTQPIGYVRNYSDYDDRTEHITNIPPQTFYEDFDGDGFGNPNVSVYYSVQPVGYVTNNLDYDDRTEHITNIAPQTFYLDADGDGFGNPNVSAYYSFQPAGYVTNNLDYDDGTEHITNIPPQTFYQDADRDGFGNPAVTVYYSVMPTDYVTNNTDCDDADDSLNPNTKWYADNDKDGLGDPLNFVQQCTSPGDNYTRDNSDNCPLLSGTSSDCNSLIISLSDYNYIITTTYKEPTVNALNNPSAAQAQTNITYFDGLGRPIQQIANKQSNSGMDIITHIEYDTFGRQTQEYLPYVSTSSNMAYEENAAINTVSFYNTEKYDNTSNPFSEKKLESSPLNRVLKQAAPGNAWAMNGGHEIKFDYQTNDANEIKLYKASANWNAGSGLYEISFSDNGHYTKNQLYKTITYDENTAPGTKAGTEEFKNKEGQVVLKRTYESGIKHDTYYVYDTYGNLTYVIPPKADGAITEEALNGLCYQYKYDNNNRLAEKKVPGKQWEFIVYDKLDRPVATGPANSPFKEDTAVGWLITKYDAFSRPIYTGWLNSTANSSSRKSLQEVQNTAAVLFETKESSGIIDGIAVNYSNAIAPTSFKLLTVNYYDNYDYSNAATVPTAVEGQNVLANAKGLSTGSWIRALGLASEISGETTSTFYDGKARPVHNYIQNHLGGYTTTTSKLDFTGKPEYTITRHKQITGTAELVIKEEFTYSPQDRLLTHTHQINGGEVQLLADNEYDELGQLIAKKVGNTAGNPLQNINYSYNIRGWLTEINKTDHLQQNSDPVDLFAFKINYNNETTDSSIKSLFNGNIAETYWKTLSDGGFLRKYGYQYDGLNRLLNAIYQKSGLITNAYDESLTYDKNGNIMSLSRFGLQDEQLGKLKIDDLIYEYKNDNSNQLIKVTDGLGGNDARGFIDGNKNGDDYAYDVNGNMISDKNKDIIEIQYNHLNLPTKITFAANGNIVYIYNATGQKLEKIVTDNGVVTQTIYLGGFQYKYSDNQNNHVEEEYPEDEMEDIHEPTEPPLDTVDPIYPYDPPEEVSSYISGELLMNRSVLLVNATSSSMYILQFFPTTEGYFDNIKQKYVYQYKDHLGNIRLSYAKNKATNVLEILEENNYYPFGLKHEGYNTDNKQPNYKYKYNGKELQDELNLNVYDYQARVYAPDAPRFWQIDPLAEQGRRWSPYAYAMDNPVYFTDPDGMWPDNPIKGLISRATSAVKDYVTDRVSAVVSNTRNMVAQKANNMLSAMTPSNPFRIGKPDKPEKVSGKGGTSFTTEGGKHGGMPIPEGDRNVKTVDMTNLVVFALSVFGPETTVPGAAPDGSNPLAREGDTKTVEPTVSTASNPEGEMTTMRLNHYDVMDVPNNKPKAVIVGGHDTLVNPSARNSINSMNKTNYNKQQEKAKLLATEKGYN